MSARGFAAISREENRRIASLGGKAAHQKGGAHRFTPEKAKEAGRKGGLLISQNREHMAEIGRRGGIAVSSVPGRMSELGKKGGQSSASRKNLKQYQNGG